MALNVSLGWYSDKHMGQMLSLGLGNSQLLPSKVFGYDSIVALSRTITMVVWCVIVEVESYVLGWGLSLSTVTRLYW